MTYIPADEDPQPRRGTRASRHDHEPRQRTRPLPRLSADEFEQDSPDARAYGEAAPRESPDPRAYGEPQGYDRGYGAGAHPTHPIRTVGAPQGYRHPNGHAPMGRAPRDLSPGIVAGQLVRLVMLVAVAAAVTFYALGTASGQMLDEIAMSEASEVMAVLPAQVSAVLDLMPLAVGMGWAIIAIITAAATSRWVHLGLAVLAGAGAMFTVQVLKRVLIDKPALGIQENPMNSLPSGHTAAAAIAAMAALLAAPAAWRSFVALLAGLTTVTAGLSTVLNSWHRPADAIVSVLVVAAWCVVGSLMIRALTPAEPRVPSRAVGSLLLALLAAGAAVLGLTVAETNMYHLLPLMVGACGVAAASWWAFYQMVRTARPLRRAQ